MQSRVRVFYSCCLVSIVILEKSESEEEVIEVASADSEVGEEASKESLHAAGAEEESHAVFNYQDLGANSEVPSLQQLLTGEMY
jgi:hypothetical protein